ncbi:phosphoserine aminotransferase-like [Dendronephthya gigantea]|uniref:phosphoserine aminotransferase-like n=1 Tax=Dendronephthya gigantea TaxID=151771 RepID=UPI00106A166E|nr:phosphoserine aminotransferase-like [Dendronephthya gigantea]
MKHSTLCLLFRASFTPTIHRFLSRSSFTQQARKMVKPNAKKVINFAPGPAKIPQEVLIHAQKEMLNYDDTGVSILELSHRSKEYAALNQEAIDNIRKILDVPDNYKILFCQGGGYGQFSFVPMNLMKEGGSADYIVTGTWSSKAANEAAKYGQVNYVFPKPKMFTAIPDEKDWTLNKDASYVYYCANETVHGVEFDFIPETNGVPLVCDMSSNFLTRPVDVSKFGCIVAGAQKNVGCPGVTVVIVREDLLDRSLPCCPSSFNYKVVSDANSKFNTPPTYSVYIMGLVLKWILKEGGLTEMAKRCVEKSSAMYQVLDNSNGFYNASVESASRSRMNVVFRLPNEDLENKFVAEADEQGYMHVKGHRSVGGLRVSLYNALMLHEVEHLIQFMKNFQEKYSK